MTEIDKNKIIVSGDSSKLNQKIKEHNDRMDEFIEDLINTADERFEKIQREKNLKK